MQNEKKCRKCEQVRPIVDFVDANGLPNPRGYYCYSCHTDEQARRERQRHEAIASITESMVRKFKIIYGEYWEHYASPEYFAGALYTERDFCPYCGRPFPRAYAPAQGGNGATQCQAVIDHMDPLSKGGADSIRNAVYVCDTCNRKKCGMLFVVWLQRLKPKYCDLAREIYREKHGCEPEEFKQGPPSLRDAGGDAELYFDEDELKRLYPKPVVDGPPHSQNISIAVSVSDELIDSMVRRIRNAFGPNKVIKKGIDEP